jgi:hypothetical protein
VIGREETVVVPDTEGRPVAILEPEILATMTTLLELSGIHPSDDDLLGLQKSFRSARDNASLVYEVTGTRYESPALVFRAAL